MSKLIKCPMCEAMISPNAYSCPHCGEPMSIETELLITETQPLNIKTEPLDTRTESLNIKTEPLVTETQPLNIKTEPLDTRTELLNIKKEANKIELETKFDVWVTGYNKDFSGMAIEAISELTGLNWYQSKKVLVEVPKKILEGIGKNKSELMKKKLENSYLFIELNKMGVSIEHETNKVEKGINKTKQETKFDIWIIGYSKNFSGRGIEAIRELTRLNWYQSKKIMEEAPKKVMQGINKKELELMKMKLENAYLQIVIKKEGVEVDDEEITEFFAKREIVRKVVLEAYNNVKRAELASELERKYSLCCPICLGSNLTANKVGFGFGMAATGALLFGPVGLLGGAIGADRIKITCLNCGHNFIP